MDISNPAKSQLEMSRNFHDVSGIDNLRRAAQSGDKEALREAANQFEAIFVQMMLKSMRKAQDAIADKDSPFNSEQVKFYRDMHDQQLAVDLSSNGRMGLAEIIIQQLSPNEKGYMPASAIRNDGNLSSLNRKATDAIDRAKGAVLGEADSQLPAKRSAFASPKEFIEKLLPDAQQVAAALGLPAKALLAQAAVETGWGKYMIHSADGQNSHNLFGIKADRHWQGDKTRIDTLEYEDGLPSRQKAAFRHYPSFSESMQDYAGFVSDNPRYQQALTHTNEPASYFKALQQAGYATDPAYADKVMSVFNSELLNSHFEPAHAGGSK